MAHRHESCDNPSHGMVCTEGRITDYCYSEAPYECFDEYCSDLGHCACLCHSGKTCGCGYSWPRMEKRPRERDVVPGV